MPRTISTKPGYSVRWWRKNGYEAPERNVFAILRELLSYRMTSPAASIRGKVMEGDARQASEMFPELAGQVRLVICSPPYVDTTNYIEDQWLRLWFLGGPPAAHRGLATDDRHRNLEDYWRFLTEAWAGLRDLLSDGARLIIRIGGRKLNRDTCQADLAESLEEGLSTSLALFESRESRITGNQTRAFRPGAKGCQVEFDYHFILS